MYCNSVLIFAAAATVLSGHQNKEDAIAVLKVKLALVLYYRWLHKLIQSVDYRTKLKN